MVLPRLIRHPPNGGDPQSQVEEPETTLAGSPQTSRRRPEGAATAVPK